MSSTATPAGNSAGVETNSYHQNGYQPEHALFMSSYNDQQLGQPGLYHGQRLLETEVRDTQVNDSSD